MKTRYYVLGGLVLLILGIAIAGPYFLDLSRYKAQIEEKATQAVGRKVSIDGKLSLSILPLPHISVENITVERLLRVKQVKASIELWPLLHKEVHIRSITLQSPRVELDTTYKLPESKPNGKPGSFQVAVDKIYIEDGSVGLVHEINASLEMGSFAGPYHLKGKCTARDKKISFDLNIDGISNLINYSLALEIDKNTLEANGKIARLDQAIRMNQNQLVFRKAKIPFDLQVSWKKDLNLVGTFKNLPGNGQITFNTTKHASNLDGTLQTSFANLIGFLNWLEIKTKDLPKQLAGSMQLSTGFSYGKALQLREFSLNLDKEHFLFSGSLMGTAKKITVRDFTATLNSGMTLGGNLNADLSKEKPLINATLDISPVVIEASTAPSSGPPWTKTPIDLSALKKINGQFNITTPRISRKDLSVTNARITAKLQDGLLILNPIAGLIYGGEFLAKSSINTAGAVTFNGALKNAQIQKFVSSESKMALVDGKLSAKADFLTHGTSVYELVSHLDGTASIDSRDGTINGFDLDAIAERLANLDNIESILGLLQVSLAKGKTSFRTYNGDIIFKEGIGMIHSMTLATQRAKGVASGIVDLPRYTLNIQTNLEVTHPAGLPSFGMRFTGPLDSPHREYDLSGLRDYLLKNVIKGQLPGLINNFFRSR